jgi:hypothetical protein
MRLKTVLAGVTVACGLTAASTAGATANIMWCVGDPPAQVSSASGTQFNVNTQIYSTVAHQHLSQYLETVTTTPDGSGGTLVTVDVEGPAGQYFTVVASVHKGKGTISAQSSGTGEVFVVLDVPIA